MLAEIEDLKKTLVAPEENNVEGWVLHRSKENNFFLSNGHTNTPARDEMWFLNIMCRMFIKNSADWSIIN